jgi:membrane protease YdiL (CAAX protease family)
MELFMSPIHRRILRFFALACALSWFGHLGNWMLPSNYWPLPMNPLGPLIAAPVIIWASAGWAGVRAWLGRIGYFRAPLWAYGAALVTPVVIILAALWLAAKSGADLRPLPPRAAIEFLILVPVMLIAGPVPEELSFRGYGQFELQQTMSPLAAALWIGVGVVVWHVPLFWLGHVPYPFIVTLVAVSVVYAWLYRVSGSIWPAVALHWSVNYFGGEYLGTMITTPAGQTVYAWYFMAFYVLWALTIVWRCGSDLKRDMS